jgi:hypothetical protein
MRRSVDDLRSPRNALRAYQAPALTLHSLKRRRSQLFERFTFKGLIS